MGVGVYLVTIAVRFEISGLKGRRQRVWFGIVVTMTAELQEKSRGESGILKCEMKICILIPTICILGGRIMMF